MVLISSNQDYSPGTLTLNFNLPVTYKEFCFAMFSMLPFRVGCDCTINKMMKIIRIYKIIEA